MANYEVNVPKELLPGLLSDKEPLAKLIEVILNQILEAQMTEHLKAKPHERTEDRQGYRNGSRIRTLTARVGPLTLIIPRSRDGSFSPEIFRRYQSSEGPRFGHDGDELAGRLHEEGYGDYLRPYAGARSPGPWVKARYRAGRQGFFIPP